jgi:hypothetical protein
VNLSIGLMKNKAGPMSIAFAITSVTWVNDVYVLVVDTTGQPWTALTLRQMPACVNLQRSCGVYGVKQL